MAAPRQETSQSLPTYTLDMKDSGMHGSSIEVSKTEHQDGTQATPETHLSPKTNQYDVVIRRKSSQYEGDTVEKKIGSDATIKTHNNDIELQSNPCSDEKWEEGDAEAAVNKDIAIYREVRPNDEPDTRPSLEPREADLA